MASPSAAGRPARAPIACAEVQGYTLRGDARGRRPPAGVGRRRGRPRTGTSARRCCARGSTRRSGCRTEDIYALGARRRQAAGRRGRLEHRTLPVERHRAAAPRRRRHRPPDRARHVHRIRHPHPLGAVGRLQPGRATTTGRCGRTTRCSPPRAWRLRTAGCRSHRHRADCSTPSRPTVAGFRSCSADSPRREAGAGELPRVVLAPGVGRRDAVRDAADRRRTRPRPAARRRPGRGDPGGDRLGPDRAPAGRTGPARRHGRSRACRARRAVPEGPQCRRDDAPTVCRPRPTCQPSLRLAAHS